MEEATIVFKHSPNINIVSQDLKNWSELAEMILEYVNLKKVLEIERIAELFQLVNENEISKIVSQEFKNKIYDETFCNFCNKLKKSCFECGCRICDHFFEVFSKKLYDAMKTEKLETYLMKVDEIECPECNQKISESEIRVLNPNHDEFIDKFRKREIITCVENNKNFSCFTCKKDRGFYLLPKPDYLPCLHMCKLCISSHYYKNKAKSCAECKSEISLRNIIKEKYPCTACKKEYHIVGDRMIEIDPGNLLCPTCGVKVLEQGYSEYANRPLNLKEKIENYSYLYLECGKCGNDEFFRKCTFKLCCCKYFCNLCSSRDAKCPICKKKI